MGRHSLHHSLTRKRLALHRLYFPPLEMPFGGHQ